MRPISQSTPRLTPIKRKNGPDRIIGRQPKIAVSTQAFREKKQFPWRPIMRISLLSGLTFLIVWALNSPLFTIRHIQIDGLKNVSRDVVLQHVPPHTNLWTFRTKEVAEQIKKSSLLIADVGIYRGIPDTIRIAIAERTLVVDWESNGKHVSIGRDGRAIVEGVPNQPMIHIIDTTNLEVHVGDTVATPGFIHFVETADARLNDVFQMKLDHLEVGITTFDVTVVAEHGPRLVLDSTRNAEIQMKAAKLVTDQYGDKIKQYVDLRVPGKAYYQ